MSSYKNGENTATVVVVLLLVLVVVWVSKNNFGGAVYEEGLVGKEKLAVTQMERQPSAMNSQLEIDVVDSKQLNKEVAASSH